MSRKMHVWTKTFPEDIEDEDNDDGEEEEEEWEGEGEGEGDKEKIELKELAARTEDDKDDYYFEDLSNTGTLLPSPSHTTLPIICYCCSGPQ